MTSVLWIILVFTDNHCYQTASLTIAKQYVQKLAGTQASGACVPLLRKEYGKECGVVATLIWIRLIRRCMCPETNCATCPADRNAASVVENRAASHITLPSVLLAW